MSLCLSLCPLSSVFGRSPPGMVEKWELGWAGVVGRGGNSPSSLPYFPVWISSVPNWASQIQKWASEFPVQIP